MRGGAVYSSWGAAEEESRGDFTEESEDGFFQIDGDEDQEVTEAQESIGVMVEEKGAAFC